MSRPEQQLYEFGPFRLNAREQMLLCDGQPVRLTPKVFDTLLVLVRHNGRLLEKDELMQEIWPGQFVEEINLTVNISALRKVLGESQGGPRFIETIPKRGYRFIAPVRAVLDEDGTLLLVKRTRASISIKEEEEEQLEEEETETAEGSRQKTERNIRSLPFVLRFPLSKIRAASPRQQITASVTFAAALLICAAAVSSYVRTRKTTAETAPNVAVHSIAVLPFKPMISDAPRDEYLGNGMADSLTTRLGNLKGLVVRPINATMKYSD